MLVVISSNMSGWKFLFPLRCLLVGLLSLSCFRSSSAEEIVRYGLATADITPPGIGWRRYGYYEEQMITGVHDPLFAKTIVMEQGGVKVAFEVCDLCFITRELCAEVRNRASSLTGISGANIIICATHTHSGPDYAGVLRDVRHEQEISNHQHDDHEPVDYFPRLVDACVTAIVAANNSLAPVRLKVGELLTEGVAYTHRNYMPDGRVFSNTGMSAPIRLYTPLTYAVMRMNMRLVLPIIAVTIGGLFALFFVWNRRMARSAIVLVFGFWLCLASGLAFFMALTFLACKKAGFLFILLGRWMQIYLFSLSRMKKTGLWGRLHLLLVILRWFSPTSLAENTPLVWKAICAIFGGISSRRCSASGRQVTLVRLIFQTQRTG